MPTTLHTLRQAAPAVTPEQFLRWNPGAWVQYFGEGSPRGPRTALSTRTFDPAQAERLQRAGCAVTFSLQAFGGSRTKAGLLCYRNLGVDVDLAAPPERPTLSDAEIDRRKDRYLRRVLLPFPLKPHWVIETRHGFHLVFRVQPQREPKLVARAMGLSRRLVDALHGDPLAALPTQLLRVPGTLHQKNRLQPFRCTLLRNLAPMIPPYPLDTVRVALDVWEVFAARSAPPSSADAAPPPARSPRWRAGLAGVPAGDRNVTAASLAGRILRWLPTELWETAGWGGLREWNARNTPPLPDRELRAVYTSITRREAARRQPPPSPPPPNSCSA